MHKDQEIVGDGYETVYTCSETLPSLCISALSESSCKEVKQNDLPVVIGELGNGGLNVNKNMLIIRKAQKSAAQSLGSGAVFVSTSQFAREANDSPNVGHGHHWFGNAESYFLIGDALGKALLRLNKK